MELHIVIGDLGRYHFSWHGIAIAIESAANGLGIIIAGDGNIVLQSYRLRID